MRGDFDEDEYDEDDHDDSFDDVDCGMGPDGQCQYAGTEECDECPYWDDMPDRIKIELGENRRREP